MAKRRTNRINRTGNRCRFCRDSIDVIDYKDLQSLNKLFSSEGRLLNRKRSGTCSRHQRMAKQGIKRARYLALMPYVT